MKSIITVATIFFVLLFSTAVMAQEKPLIIKGLYIGMKADEAKQLLTQLLPNNWKVSKTGETYKVLLDCNTGDGEIFGKQGTGSYLYAKFCPGERGFAIIRDNSCEGYISTDKLDNIVIRMSFSGNITDILFSTAKIDAEEFATSFWGNYNMPAFNWIPHGWQYVSPKGYTISIMTDKLIDIKDNTLDATNSASKRQIKFD